MITSTLKFYLVLDLGTTNVKAFVFDDEHRMIARSILPLKKIVKGVIVEQNPLDLLNVSKKVLREAVSQSGIKKFMSLGITTQRETTIAWDANTGKLFYNAIVWEDQRTKDMCAKINGRDKTEVRKKTGLPVDSYFSATKMAWLLQNRPAIKAAADLGSLRFGTPDSWLLWNFLKHNPHITDYTNASRTLLFNIKTLKWDKQLLNIFGIPHQTLPTPHPSISEWGVLKKDILGFEIPVHAVAGDQQSSLHAAGQAPGTTKVTYGTGTFIMQILGPRFVLVPGFFTTLAVSKNSQKLYACEAKINIGAKQVEPLLNKPAELKRLIASLTGQVSKILVKLPKKPDQVVIDGGIANYQGIISLQSKNNNLKIVKQISYEGTALGIAKMLVGTHVH